MDGAPDRMSSWSAVILAGGAGRRLGGVDKAAVEIHGRTLLERALAATAGAAETIVVGPERSTSRPVRFVREQPAGSGPAAAVLAGAGSATYDVLLVLAVDMPLVSTATVGRLLAALDDGRAEGAVLADDRRQPLCAAYRRAALLAAAPPDPTGLAVRDLVAGLHLVDVAALPGEADDVDEGNDADRIEARLLHQRRGDGESSGS